MNPAIKHAKELDCLEYGQYTSSEAFENNGFDSKTFWFKCIGHYEGKAIIITATGRVHLKDDGFVFMVLGSDS